VGATGEPVVAAEPAGAGVVAAGLWATAEVFGVGVMVTTVDVGTGFVNGPFVTVNTLDGWTV